MGVYRYDAVELFDLGFGPRLVSVTPPGCNLSPTSTIHPKHRGKAPGAPTASGWIGVNLNDPKTRCLDYATAKRWRDDWGANVGFVLGDGFIAIDNDQGAEFSAIFRRLLPRAPRRFVKAEKHDRDAFLVRIVDFVGDGVAIANANLVFRNGVKIAKIQLLASSKQFVVAGVHPETLGPYVWDRELPELGEIPRLSVEEFDALLEGFLAEAKALGWVLEGPAPRTAPSVPPPRQEFRSDSDSIILANARALLDEIPNRDAPAGEENAVDRWLEIYENWIKIGYALAAFLGVATAHTPEALDAWRTWSDGKAQNRQTSESVWRSVLGQPLRYGGAGLLRLVRSLVKPSFDDFPDIDPDDPMINSKTPVWGIFKEEWLLCTRKGFAHMTTRLILTKQQFNDKYAYLAKALCRELRPGHRGKIPTVAELFLEQPNRREVLDVVYAPGGVRFIDTHIPNLPLFNFWRPTTHGQLMASAADVKPWLDHVEFVLGSTRERDRFVKWCAFVAQHPQLKPNWHFLIISFQGVGKDTLVRPVKLAVGDDNWKEELIYQLADNFNDVIEHKLLIIGETAQPKSGFTSAHDLSTRLKPLLAQPPEFLTVNKKYQSPYKIPNRIAVILFSNEENPLYLERDQRRVHVVNRRDVKAEPPGYYQKLWAWLEQGGDELAASYLLHYPLTDVDLQTFIGGVAPASDDKTELEHLNIHPGLAALEELLADAAEGKGPFRHRVATQSEVAEHLSGEVRSRPSSQLVRTWMLDMERRKTGVRRLRIDPKAPHLAGLVSDGARYSGRLWLLGEEAPDGRAWTDMTNTEIVALWKNLPPPKNATVHRHPAAGFADDEEPV